jgi:hypothetical protein
VKQAVFLPKRVVQQDHIAVSIGGAGQADALLLPAAEVHALLAYTSQECDYTKSTKQNSEEHIVIILCVYRLYTLPEKQCDTVQSLPISVMSPAGSSVKSESRAQAYTTLS